MSKKKRRQVCMPRILTKEEIEREERVQRYVTYIKENTKMLVREVTDIFQAEKEEVAEELLSAIEEEARCAIHYKWEDDGCPYDFSGIIVEDGDIDASQSIRSFLENEKTGVRYPTFQSGCGFAYQNYNEAFSDNTREYAAKLVNRVLKEKLEEYFGSTISDNEITDALDRGDDEIYYNTPESDFTTCIGALEFCEVDLGMPLEKLYQKKK